jgi:hypothetical protein
MKTRSTTQLIAAVVAAVAALTILAGVAQAAKVPAGMTKAEYRALMLRSEALNEKYRLDTWKGVPAGMTAPAYRALMLRSEALNRKYGLGGRSTATVAPAAGPSDGFGWGAFGIGAAAMLGFVLIGVGAIAGRRFARQAPRVRTS